MATRVKVNPGTATPTHSLSVSDGAQTWGLILVDGARSIQENSISPSTLLINSQGKRYGDSDPSMSHIEQANWAGGRGNENFTTDETRYYDSQNQWTTVEESTFPTLQWKYATGYRNQDMNQPGTIYNWRPLVNITYSISFTASASYSADKAYLWLRKVGTPGTLTLEIWSNSSNLPGAMLKSATITSTDVTDILATLVKFDWTGTQSLVSGTQYHLIVYGAATDSISAHWEVMTGKDVTSIYTYTSANRTNWTTTIDQLYYRICDADTDRTWKFFIYNSKLNAVDIKASGTSQLYNTSGTAFSEVTTTGFSTVTDVIVNNGTAYFAQGESTNIRRWDGTTNFADDGTNKATFLYSYFDATAGPRVWRANTSSSTSNVSAASSVAWGTNLTFGTDIKVGDTTFPITNLVDYNNYLWVMKQDSVWNIQSDKAYKLSVGIDDSPNPANGTAATAHGLYLMFSFLGSVERMYGTTLDDVGPGRGAGLPSGRQGYAAAFDSVIAHLYVAIDAGTAGTSSVLVFDGINYHEIFRAPEVGKRIRAIRWQPGSQTVRPILWIDCGGDIVYMTFPLNTFNPLRDSGMYFNPEGVLISSTFDAGASRLPKLFKDFTAITKNLDGFTKIALDYQLDDDVGTSNWITVGSYIESPVDTLSINEGKKYSIRFRLRFQTHDATKPPVLIATVLEGIARTPVKYQWVIKVKTSSIQSTFTGAPDHNPDKLLTWLKEKAGGAEVLYLHSTLTALDGKVVMAEPPNVMRDFSNSVLKFWGGQLVIVLREA